MKTNETFSALDTMIRWASSTDMKNISVAMLLSWMKELKEQELESQEEETAI